MDGSKSRLRQVKFELTEKDVFDATRNLEERGLTASSIIQLLLEDMAAGCGMGYDVLNTWLACHGITGTPENIVTYIIHKGYLQDCMDSFGYEKDVEHYYGEYKQAGGTQSKTAATRSLRGFRDRLNELQSGWG